MINPMSQKTRRPGLIVRNSASEPAHFKFTFFINLLIQSYWNYLVEFIKTDHGIAGEHSLRTVSVPIRQLTLV